MQMTQLDYNTIVNKSAILERAKLSSHQTRKTRAVYLLFCEEEVVYIGITDNLDWRLRTHNIVKKSEYDSCYFLEVPFETDSVDGGLSRAIEKAFIKQFNPRLNTDLKDGKLTYPEVWLLRQIFGDDLEIEY